VIAEIGCDDDQQRRVARPARGLIVALEQKFMIAGNNDLHATMGFSLGWVSYGV
jgi:hypothetical protein